jgi:beta-1,4-mannosyltransferase
MTSAASFAPEPLPQLRADRPALVVSSTSWTPDEDFRMLLDALSIYERRARIVNKAGNDGVAPRLPRLMMLVTGRGDLRDEFMKNVIEIERAEEWAWTTCRSVWMSAADYPTLLG